MSSVATFPAVPQPPAGNLLTRAASPTDGPASGANPHHRGGKVLFEMPFRSAMTDADLALLAHVLDLWTQALSKMNPDPNSPGVARLDHSSGLFLERGAGKDRWVLQGRTWGKPAPASVHEWHLLAAQAARQLDRDVPLPERLVGRPDSVPDLPSGRATHGRLSRLCRRVSGLS